MDSFVSDSIANLTKASITMDKPDDILGYWEEFINKKKIQPGLLEKDHNDNST